MFRRLHTMVALVALCAGAPSQAQTGGVSLPNLLSSDEWERYQRVLQVAGLVPQYPWGLRAFGPHDAERLRPTDGKHPWNRHGSAQPGARGPFTAYLLPISAQVILNSRFPYGFNDGAVWAGRGVTTAFSGGGVARAGPLTATLAPVFFRAENDAFNLRPNGYTGQFAFGHGLLPDVIDQPQRFGERAYQRLDPGPSSLRLDVRSIAAGISTGNEQWGPGRDHPMILGNNAPGFTHVFLGTSQPVTVPLLRVHGRLIWGKLEQTRYSPMDNVMRHRLGTGAVVSVSPRHVPGLELGGARFFHLLWSDGVLNAKNLTKPISGLLKISRIDAAGNPHGDEPDNQLASVFARWVFPRAGLELYGEYTREDNAWNMRDFKVEPDHNAGYLIGFQRTWQSRPDARRVVRGELLNTRISPLELVRPQVSFYIHSPVRQGHTNRGQVLGSAGAFGGGAGLLAFDNYTERGRATVSWSRIMRAEHRLTPAGTPNPYGADVFHALGIEGLRFRGRFGITYELTGVYEINRDFAADAFNLRAATGMWFGW